MSKDSEDKNKIVLKQGERVVRIRDSAGNLVREIRDSEDSTRERAIGRSQLVASIIQAEIIGRKISGVTVSDEEVPPPTKQIIGKERRLTNIMDRDNFFVKNRQILIDTKPYGDITGVIKEITVRSSTNGFGILIEMDDRKLLDRSYTDLQDMSPYLSLVDVFEVDSKYILHINQIHFLKNAYIALIADDGASITFDQVVVVWEQIIEE